MTKFEACSSCTEEQVAAFLAKRRELLTTAPGNLLDLSSVGNKHYPFFNVSYSHSAILKAIDKYKVTALPAQELIYEDPYTASTHHSGYAIWDAAVGIPATVCRDTKYEYASKVKPLRNCNTYWINDIPKYLSKVGPLGPNKELLRPSGPYIVDFMALDNGWRYLELAHELAHRRTDHIECEYRHYGMSPSIDQFNKALAEVAIAYTFGLPLYIGDSEFEPMSGQYGLDVCVNTRFNMPHMRIQSESKHAPIPNKSIAYISAAVHIQPHPYGFTTGTLQLGPSDHWSCMPTMVILTGWESVDYITHAPLVINGKALKNRNYVLPVQDLMPPDTISVLLHLAKKRLGDPVYDADHVNLDDWMNNTATDRCGKTMDKRLESVPLLPCRFCIQFNSQTDNRPVRPALGDSSPEWDKWVEDYKKVCGILQHAKIEYNRKFICGRMRTRRISRERNAAYTDKLDLLKEDRIYRHAKEKIAKGKRLTNKELRIYKARRKDVNTINRSGSYV